MYMYVYGTTIVWRRSAVRVLNLVPTATHTYVMKCTSTKFSRTQSYPGTVPVPGHVDMRNTWTGKIE